jgi:leucyl-tRNA synthetase
MEYNIGVIESKWKSRWSEKGIYQVSHQAGKPKWYVLDMFPYPSGAGLHVGHPLGYIAGDIYSRYKRLKGFNVLHPMGFDSFGLPAEQYAIETGQHPANTTQKNIATFKKQLDKIGFCYDWSREVITSEPTYYRWTQYLFLKLFTAWYNPVTQKAESIHSLIHTFEQEGYADPHGRVGQPFSKNDWSNFTTQQKEDILMRFRLAYSAEGEVNWCEALGTVLANDEVVNGVSERGGHPVVRKKMRQWFLRITDYADRLLEGLNRVDFSESMKEMQRNWIGRSEGAEIDFAIDGKSSAVNVFTTRPDTIFGVDFLVLAPEHPLVPEITHTDEQANVDEYLQYVNRRSDRERMAESKKVTGCFTGAYAVHPFTGKKIPVWIAEYVLAGYGTGAIMAVPCGDQRDFLFATHFKIPITNILGDAFTGEAANPSKEVVLQNADFLTGQKMAEAIELAIQKIETGGFGKRKVQYKIHDAGFSRQRYWGEPFPIRWENGIPVPLTPAELPLLLPHVEKYGPGPNGQGPLANLDSWAQAGFETSTMPGFAGSSWYFLRYMDPSNTTTFCDRTISDYWNAVDVYIGGTEHAVGHLLYSRMWTKVFYDLDLIGFDEPFKRLINQGMIQGSSRFVYRKRNTQIFVSHGLIADHETDPIHVDVQLVDGLELDIEAFRSWKPEFAQAEFLLENGKYICGQEVEKMSKSKFNTVNPDDLVEKYGADTFRMYEMFLGPIEQSKPWDTKGIEGVHRFLKKLWRLFFQENQGPVWTNEIPTPDEWKILHRTIQKVDQDTENFHFNTAVSAFMVCVNDLTAANCHKKAILEQLLILLAPYAPHIAEELWEVLGNSFTILDAPYPVADTALLIETEKSIPVSINGKTRTTQLIALDATQQGVEQLILANPVVQKWLEGKTPKKIIYVKGKMVNVVV